MARGRVRAAGRGPLARGRALAAGRWHGVYHLLHCGSLAGGCSMIVVPPLHVEPTAVPLPAGSAQEADVLPGLSQRHGQQGQDEGGIPTLATGGYAVSSLAVSCIACAFDVATSDLLSAALLAALLAALRELGLGRRKDKYIKALKNGLSRGTGEITTSSKHN